MRKMKHDVQLFHKSFYPYHVLLTAIRDYRHIAQIELDDVGAHYRCTFTNCVAPTARVIHEFDNYLIELMNSQGANFA